MSYKLISERLCVIGFQREKNNISIINVHASSEEKEEKDMIYVQLEEECEKLPRHYSAKIGKEKMYRSIIGRYSNHEIYKDNGYIYVIRERGHSQTAGCVIKLTVYWWKEIIWI